MAKAMGGKKFKLELNSAGVVQMLKDPGVAADMERRAAAFAAAAEGEWAVSLTQSKDRAVAFARTADRTAMQTAAETPGAVISALSAGRG